MIRMSTRAGNSSLSRPSLLRVYPGKRASIQNIDFQYSKYAAMQGFFDYSSLNVGIFLLKKIKRQFHRELFFSRDLFHLNPVRDTQDIVFREKSLHSSSSSTASGRREKKEEEEEEEGNKLSMITPFRPLFRRGRGEGGRTSTNLYHLTVSSRSPVFSRKYQAFNFFACSIKIFRVQLMTGALPSLLVGGAANQDPLHVVHIFFVPPPFNFLR